MTKCTCRAEQLRLVGCDCGAENEEIERMLNRTHGFHCGYLIRSNEDGFYWDRGGYCDSLAEIKQDIEAFVADERARYADIDTPADTPCLPDRYPY